MQKLDPRQMMAGDVASIELTNNSATESFENGLPEAAQGWEYHSTNNGRIVATQGGLQMDATGPANGSSLNEAIVHLNLEGRTGVKLSLAHDSIGDENTSMPASFAGHHNSDGIAISADGENWHRLTSLTTDFSNRTFDLDSAISDAGIDFTTDFQIKFQQYDNFFADWDGRLIDDIRIDTDPLEGAIESVTEVIARESFDSSDAANWSFNSTAKGHIQLDSGRLEMDSSQNGVNSLNEAVFHVDLQGRSGVTLQFDHDNTSDENRAMPGSFTGSHNSDGVAISSDGVTWHRLTSLTSDFLGKSFDLDAAIQAAGIEYTSDFQIKFQQYDNYSMPIDGRAIDNVIVMADAFDNSAPIGVADTSYSVDEDGPLTVNAALGVLANDSDADGDSLTATIAANPEHGQVTLNDDGSFDYTPDADYHGEDSFSYTVSDGTLASSPVDVAIVIRSVNDAPVIQPIALQQITQGTTQHTIDLDLSDVDGDQLTVNASVITPDVPVTVQVEGEKLVYTIDPGFVGDFETTVSASDGFTEVGTVFAGRVDFELDALGVLHLNGSDVNDAALISESEDGFEVKITFGIDSSDQRDYTRTFDTGKLQAVRFNGRNGDDIFHNLSTLDVLAYGGNGDDVLIGGGGSDTLQGGEGDDLIVGGGGNDVMDGRTSVNASPVETRSPSTDPSLALVRRNSEAQLQQSMINFVTSLQTIIHDSLTDDERNALRAEVARHNQQTGFALGEWVGERGRVLSEAFKTAVGRDNTAAAQNWLDDRSEAIGVHLSRVAKDLGEHLASSVVSSIREIPSSVIEGVRVLADAFVDFADRLDDVENIEDFGRALGYVVRDLFGAVWTAVGDFAIDIYSDAIGTVFGRRLSQPERDLAHSVFGAKINLTQTMIVHTGTHGAGMVGGNTIFMGGSPLQDLSTKALFIHELTHVWQDQRLGTKGTPEAAQENIRNWFGDGHPQYEVDATQSLTWDELGAEQQASLTENFVFRFGVDPARWHLSSPTGTYLENFIGTDDQERDSYLRRLMDSQFLFLRSHSDKPAGDMLDEASTYFEHFVLNHHGEVFRFSTAEASGQKVGGRVNGVNDQFVSLATSSNQLYALHTSGIVYRLEGVHQWESVGGGQDVRDNFLAVASTGSRLFALHQSGEVYRLKNANGWERVGGGLNTGDAFVSLMETGGQLFVLHDSGIAYRYMGQTDRWQQIGGSSSGDERIVAMSQVESDVFMLHENGDVYRYITQTGQRQRVGGGVNDQDNFLEMVAIGSDLFVLHQEGKVYRYEGSPDRWQRIAGGVGANDSFVSLATVQNELVALHKEGGVYRYNGQPDRWDRIGGQTHSADKMLAMRAVGGSLFTLHEEGKIYLYLGRPDAWERIAGGTSDRFVQISLVGNTLAGRHENGNLYLLMGNPDHRILDGASSLILSQSLMLGQSIHSPNGKFSLTMQQDGLVLYYNATQEPIWRLGANGQNVDRAILTYNGDLAVFSGGTEVARTTGSYGAKLIVQDDGNLVIRHANGTATWRAGTDWASRINDTSNKLTIGEELHLGESVVSSNRRFELHLARDGDLVLRERSTGRVTWRTGTAGQGVSRVRLHGDGRFVLYRDLNGIAGPIGTPIGAPVLSGLQGNAGAALVVQDDGNLVGYSHDGRVLAASNTYYHSANLRSEFVVNGRTYGLHQNGRIYRINHSSWEHIGGTGNNDKFVELAAAGDHIYAVHQDGRVYRFRGTAHQWDHIGGGGSSSDRFTGAVGVGSNLFVMHRDGRLYRYEGAPHRWQHIGGGGNSADRFTGIASLSGHLFVMHQDGRLYRYEGTPHRWQHIGGSGSSDRFTEIHASRGSLIVLHASGRIYRYNGQPHRWQRVGGGLSGSDQFVSLFRVGSDLMGTHANGTTYVYGGSRDRWL